MLFRSINKVDTTLLSGNWKVTKAISQTTPLATYAKETITENDFANWIVTYEKKSRINAPKEYIINYLWDIYIEGHIMLYEKANLTKKYPELGNLLKEYHDGMLLFDLIDRTIWSKSNTDSIGVEAYFNKNKTNYMWGQRVSVNYYTCKDQTSLDALQKLLSERTKKKYTDEQIISIVNKKTPNSVTMTAKKYSKGEDADVDKLETKPNAIIVLKNNCLAEFKAIVQPEPKVLEECRGLVISDYQKQLEDQWLISLREKNKVIVDQTVLKTIKNTLK